VIKSRITRKVGRQGDGSIAASAKNNALFTMPVL
jgi:hypothetical protein